MVPQNVSLCWYKILHSNNEKPGSSTLGHRMGQDVDWPLNLPRRPSAGDRGQPASSVT